MKIEILEDGKIENIMRGKIEEDSGTEEKELSISFDIFHLLLYMPRLRHTYTEIF